MEKNSQNYKNKKLNSFISLDTRKVDEMLDCVDLINDVSGLNYDSNTINVLKKETYRLS